MPPRTRTRTAHEGRAVVARQAPFTIRLKDRTFTDSEVDGVQLRIDPGSKGTGIAVTDVKTEPAEDGTTITVRRGLISIELEHRGEQIHQSMRERANYRRRRRSANLRHRPRRFDNRTRVKGWLPPSLRHRVDTTLSNARRLCQWAPVTEIHVERAAFDTHAMSAGKSLTAAEYQHGTLAGTEIREYLLAKWDRSCAYCGVTGVPLNIDHIHPRSRGGSSRISNLTLACVPCNQAKGATTVEDFLAQEPGRLAKVLRDAGTPLQDAGAMNSTRWQLTDALHTLDVPVHAWSGGRTKWNRIANGLGKSHTLDALAIGHLDHAGGDGIVRIAQEVCIVKATGRGKYARTTPDRFGFPRLQRPRTKLHHGYATGDLVQAHVPRGKWMGVWVGRIAVRTNGQHRLTTLAGRFDVSHRNLRLLQRADGYSYAIRQEILVAGNARKLG